MQCISHTSTILKLPLISGPKKHFDFILNLPLDTIVKFYAGGLINIGITWITRNEKYSKEELVSYMDKLLTTWAEKNIRTPEEAKKGQQLPSEKTS